ncbi:MAG: hypothetical protein Q8P51_02770 [Ignavibacteria bacterium]|nr:hypothetical protein [Ignavibacteria bacterium]
MKEYMTPMLLLNLILAVLTGYGHSVEGTDAAPSVVLASAALERFVLSIEHNGQDKEYKEAMDAARKLLKEPIGTPPVPPDINLKCSEGVALERLGGVYYKSLVQPEEALCQRLLSAAKQLRLASSDAEEKANEAISTAGLLFKRNFRKVDAIIRSYKPSPEKFGAVGYASLRVYKEAALLGEKEPPPYGVFSEWAAKAADKYLEELRSNHDYKAISAVVQLTKEARMLGMPEADLNFFDKMARAMNFKVDFDVSCWVSIASQRVVLKGSGKLTPDAALVLFTGEGEGQYVSYSKGASSGGRMEVPNNYSVSMKLLEFKPCDGTAKLFVDKIGADKETWISPQTGERFTAPGPEVDLFVKTVVDQLFQGYRGEGGGFEFSMPISNLQAQMCTGNFTQTGTITTSDGSTSASITYNVTITHTPK